MNVMILKDANGNESAAFFVDVMAGEVRVRGAAIWDAEKRQYVEATFDVVTQTVKSR